MTERPRERDDDGGVDVEAAWADIVAHWDTDRPPAEGWPAGENTTDAEAAPEHTSGADTGPVATADPGPAPLRRSDVNEDWGRVSSHVGGDRVRDAAAAPEPVDEEHYVPPEPPPLTRGDWTTTLAWAGVLGSPVFFLLSAIFWQSVPRVLILAAIGAFVAGFVVLVLRMPNRRDPEDYDDGAVV